MTDTDFHSKSADDVIQYLLDYLSWYLDDNGVNDDVEEIVESLNKKYGSYNQAYHALEEADVLFNREKKEKNVDEILRPVIEEIEMQHQIDTAQKEYQLRDSAKNGDEKALFELGIRAYSRIQYTYGKDAIKGANEAICWFLKMESRIETDTKLQNIIGNCYLKIQDYEQAFEWYLKSKNAGNIEAGNILMNRNELLKLYAEGGELNAQRELGHRYFTGHKEEVHGGKSEIISEIRKDVKKAIFWLTKVAEAGDISSLYYLGLCYKEENDYSRAIDYLKKYAEQTKRKSDAFFQLGDCYFEIGEQNKAFDYYMQSAEGGNIAAMNKVGDCYKFGIGVEQNATESEKWHKKAKNRDREINRRSHPIFEDDSSYMDAFDGCSDAVWNID